MFTRKLLNVIRHRWRHCGSVMVTCRHWSVSLRRDSDDVPHGRILFSDKAKWRLIPAALCRWRRCFLADQLWFMTCIWEEEEIIFSSIITCSEPVNSFMVNAIVAQQPGHVPRLAAPWRFHCPAGILQTTGVFIVCQHIKWTCTDYNYNVFMFQNLGLPFWGLPIAHCSSNSGTHRNLWIAGEGFL